MEQTFTLSLNELDNIIRQTVKTTLEELEESRTIDKTMLSFNQARTKLKIGYKKLYNWVENGTIKTVNGMIPYSEIVKLQNGAE